MLVAIHNDDSPKTFGEAMNSIDVNKWIEVIQDEYNSLLINKTWDLHKVFEGRHSIGCKWMFCIKIKLNGSIDYYNACLVAKSYTQIFCVDFEYTFSSCG